MIKDIKILHIITDEKFPDSAWADFEKVAPNCNTFVIMGRKKKLTHIKSIPVNFVGRFAYLNPLFLKNLKKYNFVVLHSLTDSSQELIARSDKSVRFVWIGWGYDYYDLIYENKNELFKPETEKIVNILKNKNNINFKQIVKRIINKFTYKNQKKEAVVERINYFAPALKSEFDVVVTKFDKKRFPKYIDWGYGDIEQFFKIKNSISIHGNNILVGNSATPTNNHIEVFNVLKKLDLNNRKIICPLSYGDKLYGDYVDSVGRDIFGKSFVPIRDFMEKEKYFDLISGCSHVIMNHIRQQAGANIKMMIFSGAKVFLDPRNPFFDYYKKIGVKIYSINEINFQSISKPLDKDSIINNKAILQKEMKEKSSLTKTENLIKELLNENF